MDLSSQGFAYLSDNSVPNYFLQTGESRTFGWFSYSQYSTRPLHYAKCSKTANGWEWLFHSTVQVSTPYVSDGWGGYTYNAVIGTP